MWTNDSRLASIGPYKGRIRKKTFTPKTILWILSELPQKGNSKECLLIRHVLIQNDQFYHKSLPQLSTYLKPRANELFWAKQGYWIRYWIILMNCMCRKWTCRQSLVIQEPIKNKKEITRKCPSIMWKYQVKEALLQVWMNCKHSKPDYASTVVKFKPCLPE